MIRLVCIIDGNWINADTGEQLDPVDTVEDRAGGIICGYLLYEHLAALWPQLHGDWRFKLPGRRNQDQRVVRHYFYSLTKRPPAEQRRTGRRHTKGDGSKHRPRATKWIVWNFELFHNEPDGNVVEAGLRMRKLCEDRGIKPTATIGGMGRAMLKISSEWREDRYFAPPWISEIAREHLPGNHYAHREGFRRDKGIVLIDQQAAHHNIVNTIPCPDPASIRRRGRRTPGRGGEWIRDVHLLRRKMGLLHAMVEVQTIPRDMLHLYPKWAQIPGRRLEWIWTPELRFFDDDHRLNLVGVETAFTGGRLDTALLEYSDFALQQIHDSPHPVMKATLHAAYGSLAVGKYSDFEQVILGDTTMYKDRRPVRLAKVDDPAHAVTIKGLKISPLQNVIAYGVITAEQTVRSLELARVYEREYHLWVVQVYADALLVRTDQVPFVPDGWDVKADLGEVIAGAPNQIISTNLRRIPGLHGEQRRAVYVQQVHDRHTGVT